jgi:transcriptional regulator with XRE-family HTH domain
MNTKHEKYDEIRKLIKEMRRSSGVSQMKLAEKLAVSYQQIQKYENGRSSLSVGRLRAIAGVFGVPLDAFFKGMYEGDSSDENILDPHLSEDEARLVRLFRRLKDDEAKVVVMQLLVNILKMNEAAS